MIFSSIFGSFYLDKGLREDRSRQTGISLHIWDLGFSCHPPTPPPHLDWRRVRASRDLISHSKTHFTRTHWFGALFLMHPGKKNKKLLQHLEQEIFLKAAIIFIFIVTMELCVWKRLLVVTNAQRWIRFCSSSHNHTKSLSLPCNPKVVSVLCCYFSGLYLSEK